MGRQPITPDEAWSQIASLVAPLPEEHVARRQAGGRVLARSLPATLDLPAEDVSAMDGYAFSGVLAEDAELPVVATIAAGDPPGFELAPGTAVRIMTGAPLPRGADRVLEVESTTGESDRLRRLPGSREPRAADHIRRQGEIIRDGDRLLPAGSMLTPGALSLLAAHGHERVPVHRAPRVTLLTTGDEVVPPGSTPGPGQLRDSHTDFLLAALATLGITGQPLGIAPDRQPELRSWLERGLDADVLLVCGGISRGEFDLVGATLAGLGCRFVFSSVAIQPGQPLAVAAAPRGVVFALPGNPASVMTCFWLFARPALRRLLGSADGWWESAFCAELAAPLPAGGGRDRFLSASVVSSSGTLLVTPHPARGSHDLAAAALGTALVRVRAQAPARPTGSVCEVLPLADWRLSADRGR